MKWRCFSFTSSPVPTSQRERPVEPVGRGDDEDLLEADVGTYGVVGAAVGACGPRVLERIGNCLQAMAGK